MVFNDRGLVDKWVAASGNQEEDIEDGKRIGVKRRKWHSGGELFPFGSMPTTRPSWTERLGSLSEITGNCSTVLISRKSSANATKSQHRNVGLRSHVFV